jgi:hypothetical protein
MSNTTDKYMVFNTCADFQRHAPKRKTDEWLGMDGKWYPPSDDNGVFTQGYTYRRLNPNYVDTSAVQKRLDKCLTALRLTDTDFIDRLIEILDAADAFTKVNGHVGVPTSMQQKLRALRTLVTEINP